MALLDGMALDTAALLRGEFAEDVVLSYTPETTPVEIATKGIFDETYLDVNIETGARVQSQYSRVTLWEKDIEVDIAQKINADEDQNWKATIRGVEYSIVSAKRDGLGAVLLDLRS